MIFCGDRNRFLMIGYLCFFRWWDSPKIGWFLGFFLSEITRMETFAIYGKIGFEFAIR